QEEMPSEDELLELLKSDNATAKKSGVIRLVEKIVVQGHKITIHFKDGSNLPINHAFSMDGVQRQLIARNQTTVATERQKQVLLRAFIQGYIWRKQFFERPEMQIEDIVRIENKSQ